MPFFYLQSNDVSIILDIICIAFNMFGTIWGQSNIIQVVHFYKIKILIGVKKMGPSWSICFFRFNIHNIPLFFLNFYHSKNLGSILLRHTYLYTKTIVNLLYVGEFCI